MKEKLKPCSSGAQFSDCRKYRYVLWRTWQAKESHITFIGLNPSTADETKDDPTIRRCIGYAKEWGFSGIHMLNLFAYRATKPRELNNVKDPIGPENNRFLKMYTGTKTLTIACWGNHGAYRNRGFDVIELLGIENLSCLGITQEGKPKHPLYLKRGLKPISMILIEVKAWNRRPK